MISVNVSGMPSAPWFILPCSFQKITIRDGGAAYNNLYFGKFILTTSSRELETYDFKLGHMTQGSETFGRLRDREISHFNVSGTLDAPTEGFVFRADPGGNGMVDVQSTTQQWYMVDMPPVFPGDTDISIAHTIPEYTYYYGTELRRVGASTGVWTLKRSGDKFIIVAECDNGPTTRVSDGVVLGPAHVRGGIAKYRVSGASVYSHGYTSNLTHYPTEEEQLAAFASIPTSGGTLQTAYSMSLQVSTTASAADHAAYIAARLGDEIYGVDMSFDYHPVDFGDLAVEVADQLKVVDQNFLLLIVDVEDWRNFHVLWKNLTASDQWKHALSAYNHMKRTVGRIDWNKIRLFFTPGSSMYLFAKYGVLPTSSDVGRLIEGLGRLNRLDSDNQRLHARRVTSISDPDSLSAQHTAVLTVETAAYPNWFTSMVAKLKSFGVYPEVENLWDILPYSFVVDWFVQFGDLFTDVSRYLNMKNYFPIRYCMMSEKWEKAKEITLMLPDLGASGVVTFSYYTRWISRSLPAPTVSITAESLAGDHLLESFALIAQRLGR